MKTVYEARDSLEGHMIANLLEQAGIYARVDGEFLQGAVGEIQAMGLVKVSVNNDDYSRAREIVQQWESSQQTSSEAALQRQPVNYVHIALSFLAGILVGILLMS